MSRYSSLSLLCLGATLALTGCGEMVFKRGAGPGSMADAQTDCRAKTDGEQAYIACMEQQGYVIKGSQQSVFVGGADEPGPAGSSSGGSSLFVEGAAAAPAAPASAPVATKPAPVATQAAPVSAAPTAAPAAPMPAPKPATLDPLEQVDVASWWKLGGSAGQLEAAQAACVTELGNAHRPDPDSTKVTRAMVGCLRDAGWRGIGR